MHELSLTKPLVDLAIQHANKQHAVRIVKVTVTIGKLSCATPRSITWCFDALTKNTLAQGAQLVIEEVNAQAYCRDCNHTFESDKLYATCPQCQSLNIEYDGGQQFTLKSIVIG